MDREQSIIATGPGAPSPLATPESATAPLGAVAAITDDDSSIGEAPIQELLPPEPDRRSFAKEPGERAASRTYIIKWLIPFYVVSMSVSLICAVCLALWGSADHSFTNVEHILALVVAALGPVIGFYFAEERK